MTRKIRSKQSVATIKRHVRARDNHRCVECGMTNRRHINRYGRQLDVHRVIPGSRYTVEGCVTVCRSCHGQKPKRVKGEPDVEHPNRARERVFPVDVAIYEGLACAGRECGRSITDEVAVALEWWLNKHGMELPLDAGPMTVAMSTAAAGG